MVNITELITASKNYIAKNKKRVLQYAALGVCAIGFIVCVVWLICYVVDSNRIKIEQQDMANQYLTNMESDSTEEIEEEIVEPEPTPDPSRLVIGEKVYDSTDNYELPLAEVDFEGLKAENEHIYAWINIPGTQVNNPVLQHPDKTEYYLTRDENHKWSVYGTVFSQYYNSKDFMDNLTVLYGHNMKNGTMFGDLHKYEDEEFFKKHPYIYVYTEDMILVYQIFAAYEYGNVHLLLNFQMNDEYNFGLYLDSIRQIEGMRNNFNQEMEVSSADKVITLSTCVSGNKQLRYLVQGKLIAGKILNEE